jgi:hypothetical protein
MNVTAWGEMKWVGHVARMEERHYDHNILIKSLKARDRLVDLITDGNIKIYVKETGCERGQYFHLHHDWWA